MQVNRTCKECGKEDCKRMSKGMCIPCYYIDYHSKKTTQWHKNNRNRAGKKIKIYFLINYIHFGFRMKLAGKKMECVRCGYNKYFQVLCSHHLNPKRKEGKKDTLSYWMKQSPAKFVSILEKEFDHFLLYCQNCHSEVHIENPELSSQWKNKPVKYPGV
jgi:hypothetical protein